MELEGFYTCEEVFFPDLGGDLAETGYHHRHFPHQLRNVMTEFLPEFTLRMFFH